MVKNYLQNVTELFPAVDGYKCEYLESLDAILIFVPFIHVSAHELSLLYVFCAEKELRFFVSGSAYHYEIFIYSF